MNFLIIRLTSMGDIILTTPIVRLIKTKYPTSTISFITSKQYSEIYKFNPYVDNLYEYDKDFKIEELSNFKKTILRTNSNKKFDYVIDLQKNFRSKILRSGLGKKYIFTKKLRLQKLSLVYFKKPLLKKIIPIPELHRLALNELKIDDDGKGLEIWFPEQKDNDYYQTLNTNKNTIPKIAIAPGAFHYTKQYPKDKFINLIEILKNEIHCEIILIGGKKDKLITDYILQNSKFNLTDKTNSSSIIETSRVIDLSDLLISNDTGVVHIAAARKKPVVVIFGSTVKEFGFIPFRTSYEIVENDLECRPCTHYGKDKCPKLHLNCLNNIDENDIIKSVKKLLKL